MRCESRKNRVYILRASNTKWVRCKDRIEAFEVDVVSFNTAIAACVIWTSNFDKNLFNSLEYRNTYY